MDIHEAAKLLSKKGASFGGRARALSLSANRRKEIASLAAKTRWGKKDMDDVPSSDCDDPYCPCHEFRKRCKETPGECILGKPLWMVIPPEGTHLPCPVHGKHFIPGSQISW